MFMKYDYETISDNGTKYGFKLFNGNRVSVYVDDEIWGEPQGSHFLAVLIKDINKKDN